MIGNYILLFTILQLYLVFPNFLYKFASCIEWSSI